LPTRLLLSLFLASTAVGPARADDPKKTEAKKPTQSGPIYEAKKDFEREAEDLLAKLKKAKTTEEKDKIKDQIEGLKLRFIAKLIGLAEKRPEAEDTFELLVELAELSGETGKRARELIAAHHTAKAWVKPAIPVLSQAEEAAAADALAAIAKENPDRSARGLAYLFLGLRHKRQAVAAPPEKQPALIATAEKELTTAKSEYGDVRLGPGRKVAGAVTAALAGLKNLPNLVVGKTAPDIAGEDLDGKPFKLSDYKGKVVLVDFWATWCGPCMKLVPHNRRLVETYSGRPFALIGVNADEDEADLSANLKRHKVNWRSFKNTAGDGPPIAEQWNVDGFPSLYLIDHKGVIRKTWDEFPDVEALDTAVAELVAAAEKK
jgi:thiol-disulfide isomerase/thioredoxin